MRKQQSRSLRLADPTGSTFLITLMVMLLVFVLGSALATNMLTEITSSANYRTRGAALWQADSGLERTASDLLADASWAQGMVDFSTLPMVIANPFPMSSTINGTVVNYTDDGTGQPVAQYYDVGGPVALDAGTFQRQIFVPAPSITAVNATGTKAWLLLPVAATGNSGGAEASTAQVRSDLRLEVRRLTVWDNAVFGGAGQGGNAINGNVNVRGSMHVIGTPTDLIDFGGGAYIGNNYDNWFGEWGAAGSKLPPLPQQEFNGEMVDTLSAEVRVKQGTVDFSGTSEWGKTDVTGDTDKETLDGFYTDATVNNPSAIHADETGDYDATGIGFPTLDDPYFDASTSTMYATHRSYLNATALTIPVNDISNTTASFNYSDANGNSISWNQATGAMSVTGIVRVEGDLDLAVKNYPVTYSGTGTIYSTGSVHIRSNLLPTGDYLDTSAPTVHNLGIIADTDMHLATGGGESQIQVMAALYAENATYINKQSDIAGAVVAQAFDLGNQVPSVWQVPRLGTNLPPGMPGSAPMLFVTGADVTNWYHVRQ